MEEFLDGQPVNHLVDESVRYNSSMVSSKIRARNLSSAVPTITHGNSKNRESDDSDKPALPDPIEIEWHDRAACRPSNIDSLLDENGDQPLELNNLQRRVVRRLILNPDRLFFSDSLREEGFNIQERKAAERVAMKVCQTCGVRNICYDEGITVQDRKGVRGGLDPAIRRRNLAIRKYGLK